MLSQARIDYLSCFPEKAETGVLLDWRTVAERYLQTVFDTGLTGPGMPFCRMLHVKTAAGYEGELFTLPSYVGSPPPNEPGEALTCLGAALSACLSLEREKYAAFIEQCKAYLSRINGRYVVTNNVHIAPDQGDTCGSFWYDIFPSILYTLISAYTPKDKAFEEQARQIADTWGFVADRMRGDFGHIGFSLAGECPVDPRGGMESDAALGIAYLQYAAYARFGDKKYLARAQDLLREAANFGYNPYYEILGSYAPYIAARIQAETGEDCFLGRMLQYVFCGTSGVREGWGVIREKWGKYDACGLSGSTTDTQGYAFGMNTYATAAALAPVARYAPWYALELARYLMHVRKNAALFFPGCLPKGMQSQAGWVLETGVDCISYEGVRKNGATVPYATGDTRLDMNLYGAWGSGLMAALFPDPREELLWADLAAVDPFSKGPCVLLYNPSGAPQEVRLPPDVRYNLLSKKFVPETAALDAGEVMVLCPGPGDDPYPKGWETPEPLADIYENLAHGAAMSASSRQSIMYDARNASTGDWHDAWHSIDNPMQEWLMADLGQARELTRVHIIWEYNQDMVPADFEIEGSPDGKAWTALHRETENRRTASFCEVKGSYRYLRLKCLSKQNRRKPYGVTDLQVFGE